MTSPTPSQDKSKIRQEEDRRTERTVTLVEEESPLRFTLYRRRDEVTDSGQFVSSSPNDYNDQQRNNNCEHETIFQRIANRNPQQQQQQRDEHERNIQYYAEHPDDSSNRVSHHDSSAAAQITRMRTASEDFNRYMRQLQRAAPSSTRRSELPTYYRPFYTGLFRKDMRTHCYPHGWNKHCWPLLLSFLALVFTIWSGFSCQYFRGADIGFTGGRYGLWTLEDVYGKCTLWSVLFYSYDLGLPLRLSRVFSMCAMVLGLAVMTTMAQAMQCHAVSWVVGMIFTLVFFVSVSTTSTFNIWIVWGLFTYILVVLIVRAAFVHPVARRISKWGCRYIFACQILCHIFCISTLAVLKSDFCTCESLSPGRLAGRITQDSDPCDSVCALHTAGYMVLVASALWLAAAVMTLRVGIQPNRLYMSRPPEHFANYSRYSFTTRMRNIRMTWTPRASTVGVDADDDENDNDDDGDDDDDDVNDDTNKSINHNQVDDVNRQDQNVGDNDDDDEVTTHCRNTNDMETDCITAPDVARKLSFSDPTSTQLSSRRDAPNLAEWPPQRTCCQKWCCDFRITPRDGRERLIFWTFRCTLGFIMILYSILVILMIGSRAENSNAQEAPDTSPYFLTEVVCAYNPQAPLTEPFQTFPSDDAALAAGYAVAHCGACGHCSNLPDIETYVETRKTIAASTKKCGPVNFLGSFDELVDCIQERIPFSDNCAVCWAENMRNTGRECLFTCITTLFTGYMSHNNVEGAGSEGWLNHCLYCDEKLSGPDFVTCSGVSRRRLGIPSEIERNPAEQCRNVDINWVRVDFDTLK